MTEVMASVPLPTSVLAADLTESQSRFGDSIKWPVPVVARLERNMAGESEDRFAAYVEALSAALGHADRSGPFKDYCLGLLMPVERKSVEPLAAITAPGRTAAQH